MSNEGEKLNQVVFMATAAQSFKRQINVNRLEALMNYYNLAPPSRLL